MSRRNETLGYICVSQDREAQDSAVEPMAYGWKGTHAPDRLLCGRGATLFQTQTQAREALRETLEAATKDGHGWPKKRTFQVLEVRGS